MSDAALSRPTRGYVLSAHEGPEVLTFEERPTTAPAAADVLIDVEVSGVNFGDTMIRRGEYLRNQPLSMAPGCEVVGRIAAVGAESGHRVGTRVASWVEDGTGYSDRVVVEGRRAYAVPEDLPAPSIAAVFLQGVTAHWGVHRFGQMQPGESVLVHGASGGVGSLAVQLAKAGGGTVIATASSEEKRKVALEEGADYAFDSRDPETLTAKVREVTGKGCNVVVDGVGGALFMPSLRSLAPRGRYVVAGSASQTPAMLSVPPAPQPDGGGFHLLPRGGRGPARAGSDAADDVRTLADRRDPPSR
jgi:NADPH:quinone reductase